MLVIMISSIFISLVENLFFRKNGYGIMLVMSIEYYVLLKTDIESTFDQADQMASTNTKRDSTARLPGTMLSLSFIVV